VLNFEEVKKEIVLVPKKSNSAKAEGFGPSLDIHGATT
jgi:hypothetical protein